jgi:hypothetical protein
MTENNAEISVQGEMSKRVARQSLTSLGVEPQEVYEIDVSLTTGNGETTTTQIQSDGRRAGEIVSQMISGVDLDEYGPREISVSLSATDEPHQDIDKTELVLNELARYIVENASHRQGDGDGPLRGVSPQVLHDWTETELSYNDIVQGLSQLVEEGLVDQVGDSAPWEYLLNCDGWDEVDVGPVPSDESDPPTGWTREVDDFMTEECPVDEPVIPGEGTNKHEILRILSEYDQPVSSMKIGDDLPDSGIGSISTTLSTVFLQNGLTNRYRVDREDERPYLVYELNDWGEEALLELE